MPYSQLTVGSPSALKRFSHRRRFVRTAELLNVADGQTVLDYGAGDGYLLLLLSQRCPGCQLVGYDPMPVQAEQLRQNVCGTSIQSASSTASLPDSSFDRIACCEVLEHLPADGLHQVLADIRRLIKPDGRIVVTVPLEVGPASLAKNLARRLIGQKNDNAGAASMLRALFGLPSPRSQQTPYISSHVGFRHYDLPPLFEAASLTIVRRSWSPLAWAGSVLNSQVLYLLCPA